MRQTKLIVLFAVMFVAGLLIIQTSLAGCGCAGNNDMNMVTESSSEKGLDINALSLSEKAAKNLEAVRNVVSNIAGSKMMQGIRERIAPVIEEVRNMTVYRLNNTSRISIARNLQVKVRPVRDELEHIKINGTSLIVNNVSNPILNIGLVILKNGSEITKDVAITRTKEKNGLNITISNSTAVTRNEIIYENNSIYISKLNKTVKLGTLPDRIKETVGRKLHEMAEIRQMELEMENEKLMYKVKTRTRKQILGLFPADVEEDSNVNAETGEIESTDGPWWDFLAW